MTENEKRVALTHGTAVVDKNASPELIEALDNLSKSLYNKYFKSLCPKCGCNKITGDGSKAWCLNEKCDFVDTE